MNNIALQIKQEKATGKTVITQRHYQIFDISVKIPDESIHLMLCINVQQFFKLIYGEKIKLNGLILGKLFLSLKVLAVSNHKWFLNQLYRMAKLKSWGFISNLPFADMNIVAVTTKN